MEPAAAERDGDAYAIHDDQVDLGEVVLDNLLLAIPAAPLCREDCAGLCSECYADLNEGPYDLAARLGIPASKVQWFSLPYAGILAKGAHRYDLALSEIPGDVAHPKSLELSKAYWGNPLAVVVLRRSALGQASWSASSTSDQGTGPLAKAALGVVRGSSAAHYVVGTLRPASPPKRFASLDLAAKALRVGEIDGVVASLPDAWLLARGTKGARLLGTFVGSGTGLVVAVPAKGLPMGCVNAALASLKDDGTVRALAKRYLGIYRR